MIDCYIAFQTQQVALTENNLRTQPLVRNIEFLQDLLVKSGTIKYISQNSESEYTLLYTKPTALSFVHFAIERMVQVAEMTGAVMVYADHFNQSNGVITQAPVIDYQQGSLRDDFDFGSVLLIDTQALKKVAVDMPDDLQYAALYDMRLRLSEQGKLVHINEYLYYDVELDTRKSGEKLFDYVNPKNRAVQVEMERVCTDYLKRIGAFVDYRSLKTIDLSDGDFEYEASVVIPCKNRVRTIGDAIKSALNQQVRAPYKYNVIVVDDNSTDGTVDVINSFNDDRLVYIAQDSTWHAIGGNWNMALHHPKCGRFALQLDSDDMYSDNQTVQRFIDKFHEEHCAMVIGTYRITDFNLNELPPGVIDHREWTAENGMNNALRINGLGAPRGFFTPLMRQINFPTTKYGEDYAVGLRLCREYKIGRIYEVMYNCRRWDDNSDANVDIEGMNKNNLYKDRLRTWELQARLNLPK